ncbi:MAG TPA: chromosome segregation protein SMC [bacterium]|nr:chromosome segregation protein SMC [bacterium]
MFISRIILKNWKNFKELNIDLKHRVIIVGPNASGKSNLLDAIRFLRDITKSGGGLQKAVELHGGVSKIRCLSARTHSDIVIGIDLSEDNTNKLLWKYELCFNQVGGGVREFRPRVKYEKVYSEKKGIEILTRPNPDDIKDEVLLEYTHLQQPTTNSDFREIADFLNGIQYLHIIPYLVKNSRQIVLPESEDYFGKNFIERMTKVNSNTRKSFLKKIESALQYAVPQFRNLRIENDDMGIPHLQVSYKHWRGQDAKQWEDQFSDGTLRLMGLLWALLDGKQPVLLEEPELSLHSAIVRKLPEIIAQTQKKRTGIRQVFLSTHSYELLDNHSIQAEEVVLLKPTHEGTEAKLSISDEEIKTLLETGMTIAEAALPATRPPEIDKLHQLSLAFGDG